MKRSTLLPLAAVTLAVALATSACTGSNDSAGDNPEPTEQETSPRSLADVDPSIKTMLTNLGDGYNNVDGVWEGYVPNEHPVVIARKDASGKLVGAVAINHPKPDALGDATELDVNGLPFDSAHEIDNPTDTEKLENMETFEFNIDLGEVDSFAMNAGGTDEFFDPTTKDYVATFLHELFHRYQNSAFEPTAGQNIEGYDYSAENLELAVLEERALKEATTATDDSTRTQASKRFAALRLARINADPRVALDNDQEEIEGTARYIEHKIGNEDGYLFSEQNFDSSLVTDFPETGVKEIFGFGRWYASGAAIINLLEQAKVPDFTERVEQGEGPAEVLIDFLEVADDNVETLVAEARSNYDPLNELPEAAKTAAEQAADEPSVFGDETGGDDGTTDDFEEGEGTPITDEESECLEEAGVGSNATEISDEVFEKCFN